MVVLTLFAIFMPVARWVFVAATDLRLTATVTGKRSEDGGARIAVLGVGALYQVTNPAKISSVTVAVTCAQKRPSSVQYPLCF
jgi:hypothetical protein